MAITYYWSGLHGDSGTTGTSDSLSGYSPQTGDCLVLAYVALRAGASVTTATYDYGGSNPQSMTSLGTKSYGDYSVEWFYLENPTSRGDPTNSPTPTIYLAWDTSSTWSTGTITLEGADGAGSIQGQGASSDTLTYTYLSGGLSTGDWVLNALLWKDARGNLTATAGSDDQGTSGSLGTGPNGAQWANGREEVADGGSSFPVTWDHDYSGDGAMGCVLVSVAATGTQTSDTRNARTEGQETTSNSRNARTSGQVTDDDARNARTEGKITASDSRNARTEGTTTGTQTSDTRNARTHGQETTSDNRNARTAGQATCDDSRNARTAGQVTGDDNRNARTYGKATTDDSRNARTEGQISSDDSRNARTYGKATADDTRNARTEGQATVDDSRNARTSGAVTADDSRNARTEGTVTGTQTSDSRNARTSGAKTADDTRNARTEGQITSGSSRDARTEGQITSDDSRNARIYGKATIDDARNARTEGQITSDDSRNARTSGAIISDDSRNARTEGYVAGTQTSDSRNARTYGQATIEDSRAARTEGQVTTDSSRNARTAGQATASDSRNARTSGAATIDSSRAARTSGCIVSDDARNARTEGAATASDERYARTEGQVTSSSSRAARTEGGYWVSSTRNARTYGYRAQRGEDVLYSEIRNLVRWMSKDVEGLKITDNILAHYIIDGQRLIVRKLKLQEFYQEMDMTYTADATSVTIPTTVGWFFAVEVDDDGDRTPVPVVVSDDKVKQANQPPGTYYCYMVGRDMYLRTGGDPPSSELSLKLYGTSILAHPTSWDWSDELGVADDTIPDHFRELLIQYLMWKLRIATASRGEHFELGRMWRQEFFANIQAYQAERSGVGRRDSIYTTFPKDVLS